MNMGVTYENEKDSQSGPISTGIHSLHIIPTLENEIEKRSSSNNNGIYMHLYNTRQNIKHVGNKRAHYINRTTTNPPITDFVKKDTYQLVATPPTIILKTFINYLIHRENMLPKENFQRQPDRTTDKCMD